VLLSQLLLLNITAVKRTIKRIMMTNNTNSNDDNDGDDNDKGGGGVFTECDYHHGHHNHQ
jgi:hypothetical protein